MFRLSLLLMLSAAATASARQTMPMTGDTILLSANSIACMRVDDYAEVKKWILMGDDAAATRRGKISGCVTVPKGTTGLVEDVSVWHYAACVRVRGEPVCLWMSKDTFQ